MAKIERTKNATRNIIFGTLLKIYQLVVPFWMRTAIIYYMGVQYLGLNSLFSSVLQVLNLAELGVGSAMVFSMYKPIADDDTATVCALMKLYKTYYRIIGIVIAFIGLLLTPMIPKLIKGDFPTGINIYTLYIINLTATVLSYWLFAYKNCILTAHQRNDVVCKVTLVTNTIQYGLQFFVLFFFRDYYLYLIILLLSQVLTNIMTAVAAQKLYPDFEPKGDLPREAVKGINQRICDLFTAKVGSVVINSVDTIIISSFLGLTTLAVYQNYYFIMNSICGFIGIFFSSIIAGVGNSLVTESDEKNYHDFRVISFIICYLLGVCCCCFAGLYQPFMRLWVGQDLMLDYSYVILFCILFYCMELAMVWATMKDAGGLWHSDRLRPFVGSLVNLVLNIILVQFVGLYGIILSTVLSCVFVSMPWLVHNLFKYLYKGQIGQYLRDIVCYIVVALISTVCAILLCNLIHVESFLGLIVKGGVCVTTAIVIQSIAFFRKKEFKDSIALVSRVVSRCLRH